MSAVERKELTRTQEALEELGAPELLKEIAKGGHWTVDRCGEEADWNNLANMASLGLVTCTSFNDGTWVITPKGRRALKEWAS